LDDDRGPDLGGGELVLDHDEGVVNVHDAVGGVIDLLSRSSIVKGRKGGVEVVLGALDVGGDSGVLGVECRDLGGKLRAVSGTDVPVAGVFRGELGSDLKGVGGLGGGGGGSELGPLGGGSGSDSIGLDDIGGSGVGRLGLFGDDAVIKIGLAGVMG
jgi:hypothetical protein